MPSIKNIETVEQIAEEYCNNGYNKEQALKDVGYSDSYAETQGHSVVYSNVRVKKAIARIQAEKKAELVLTTEYIQQEHERLAKIAEEKSDLPTATRNKELLGKTVGAYKDFRVNLNADIPTEPKAYKAWLQSELDRLDGSDEVIDSYAKSRPAIATRH